MSDGSSPSLPNTTPVEDEKARFAVTGLNTAAAFPPLGSTQFRIVLVSFLAGGIGLLAGCIAFLLYKLIGLFTNIAFYGHFSTAFVSARHNHLGWWVIPIPVIGGLIVGIMAKYGSPKIKGHGIPEAMEAVLVNRSRIQPRVCDSEADFRRDCYRHRRPIRRGRPNHSDRRRFRVAYWPVAAHYCNRA
jgi:hypothetical protein